MTIRGVLGQRATQIETGHDYSGDWPAPNSPGTCHAVVPVNARSDADTVTLFERLNGLLGKTLPIANYEAGSGSIKLALWLGEKAQANCNENDSGEDWFTHLKVPHGKDNENEITRKAKSIGNVGGCRRR
jgi:hypothetical protein